MFETKYVCDNYKMLVTVFGHFGRQHPLSFYISVGLQHSKDVIDIEIQSPTSTNRHPNDYHPWDLVWSKWY